MVSLRTSKLFWFEPTKSELSVVRLVFAALSRAVITHIAYGITMQHNLYAEERPTS
jgi:hypothetical protein